MVTSQDAQGGNPMLWVSVNLHLPEASDTYHCQRQRQDTGLGGPLV